MMTNRTTVTIQYILKYYDIQHFQGQKVKGQLVAAVLNSQHAGTGVTWRINAKIVSTCRGRRHIVSPRT